MAEGHGFAGGGSSGGGARGGGFHGSMAPGGMRPGFARAGSRFGAGGFHQPGYGGVAIGSGSSVREIQRRLARAGYYHGPIDGVMGPQTRYAIRAYQRAHNMRVTEG